MDRRLPAAPRRWLLLAAALRGAAAGPSCAATLEALRTCELRLGAQSACSSPLVLNVSSVQKALGCEGSLADCHERCLDSLGAVGLPVNRTAIECSVQDQLMKQFSGAPDLVMQFTPDPQSGLLKPKIIPSNLAQLTGFPSFTYYGDYQRCIYSDMQYCLVEGALSLGTPQKLGALMGICRPLGCSEDEIHADVGATVKSLGLTEYTTTCHHAGEAPPPIGWTAGQVAALVLFCLIFALVAAGSALELRQRRKGSVAPCGGGGSAAGAAAAAAGGEGEGEGRGRGGQGGHGAIATFLRAWSMPRNLASFTRTRTEDPEMSMAALDGLRVLSTLWVILGHTVIWPLLSVGYDNAGMLTPPYGRLTELWFQVVPGGYFAVDTFFWLSGLLGARTLHSKVQKKPSLLSLKGFCLSLYPMAVFSRWLRLTAVYAFVLILTQTWYREIGRGALLWNAGTGMAAGMGCVSSVDSDACKSKWWASLLYINNLISYGDNSTGCMAWTWYLACDMQMFLILPLLVLIKEKLGAAVGWFTLFALTVVSVVANWVVIYTNRFVSDPMLGNMGRAAHPNFMEDVYEASWMRVQPYLLGVGSCWVLQWQLARRRAARGRSLVLAGADQELGAVAGVRPEPLLAGPAAPAERSAGGGAKVLGALLLQLFSFGLMCFVVFVPVTRYQCKTAMDCTDVDKTPWSPTVNAAYGALNHFVWALGMSILMVMCFLRAPTVEWVNWLLGASFWQPPVKLSYVAYLLHPLVLVFFYCQNDRSMQYLDATTVSNWVGFCTVVFLCSFLVWVFVEKPLANLSAQLLGAMAGKGAAGGEA